MVKLYLVGGCIRDILLGRPLKDLDFSFSGQISEFIAQYPQARRVGRSINVWIHEHCEFSPLVGGTIESDLLARDLTINAMAMDECGRLHLHPQALSDLLNKILRPASFGAFTADPARVFRLARLAAVFPDFIISDDGLAQIRQIPAAKLAALPAERVGRELRQVLLVMHKATQPGRFLRLLEAGACLSPWFAEFANSGDIPAGPPPWHNESVLEHTAQIMDKCQGNPLSVWMAMCHDLGKVGTDPKILPHHYGHELRGEHAALMLGERLRLPCKFILAGRLSAALHMKGGRYAELRPGTRRDLLWKVHQAGLDEPFWKLVRADSGYDYWPKVQKDLQTILSVKLPPLLRDKGEASGYRLREMQCEALSRF